MNAAAPKVFATPAAFRKWLEQNHDAKTELVVRIAKAGSKGPGISYAAALDEALCFGWIDGVRRRLDDHAFSIRFSPRRPGSIWSRVNVAHVERLIRDQRMHASGLRVYAARTEERTGIYSFEQKPVELEASFQARLKADAVAAAYWNEEAPWYRRTASFWVMSAKRPETRERRFQSLLKCCGEGLRVEPLRKP